jgi:hypothetical protein
MEMQKKGGRGCLEEVTEDKRTFELGAPMEKVTILALSYGNPSKP